MAKRIQPHILLGLLLAASAGLLCYRFARPSREAVPLKARPNRTVATVLQDLQPRLHPKIHDLYRRAGLSFPPSQMTLLAIKDRQRLEVWARDPADWRHIVDCPFTAFSGALGPKLREGDGQIPEGLYRIDVLNPNSRYHLSMRVSYPNEFDRNMARCDGRTQLGGDIYIHGRDVSIGCIAIGDPAIEELFYMVATTGMKNVSVIIAPCDLRTSQPAPRISAPAWTSDLYTAIRQAMAAYQTDPAASDSIAAH